MEQDACPILRFEPVRGREYMVPVGDIGRAEPWLRVSFNAVAAA